MLNCFTPKYWNKTCLKLNRDPNVYVFAALEYIPFNRKACKLCGTSRAMLCKCLIHNFRDHMKDENIYKEYEKQYIRKNNIWSF